MPFEIPEDLDSAQTASFYKKNFADRKIDTKKLNEVFMDWRATSLQNLNVLRFNIGKTINSNWTDEKTKEIGRIVLKHIPKDEDMLLLHYTEVKEVLAYATRAWEQRSKVDLQNLRKKEKSIAQKANDVREADKQAYGMPGQSNYQMPIIT